jgi:holin-like protein
VLGAITLLIVLQLVGEVIARGLALPIPGPVIGLVLLLIGLIVRGARGRKSESASPDALEEMSQGLLRHLSLLFVPAGVGVTTLFATLRDEGPAILVALAVSAVVTIVVTALVMRALAPPPDPGEGGGR